jgi:hypothetical protein
MCVLVSLKPPVAPWHSKGHLLSRALGCILVHAGHLVCPWVWGPSQGGEGSPTPTGNKDKGHGWGRRGPVGKGGISTES